MSRKVVPLTPLRLLGHYMAWLPWWLAYGVLHGR